MRIILVRHGETDHNVERRIQGHRDTPLNSRGEEQAHNVAGPLHEKEKIDAVFSSDLSRAFRTAEIIAGDKVPLQALPGLRERHMGEIEGMLHSDALKKRVADNKPTLLHYGENGTDLTKRLVDAYDEVIKISQDKGYETVVVVSHGSALFHLFEALVQRRKVGFANSKVRTAFYKRPKLGNCSITIVDNDKFETIAELWTDSIVRERDLV